MKKRSEGGGVGGWLITVKATLNLNFNTRVLITRVTTTIAKNQHSLMECY